MGSSKTTSKRRTARPFTVSHSVISPSAVVAWLSTRVTAGGSASRVVVSLSLSLPPIVLVSIALTEAVLEIDDGGAGAMATSTETTAVPPAIRSPTVQIGIPAGSSAQPAVATNDVAAGRLSVTTTPVASDGPRFRTVRV